MTVIDLSLLRSLADRTRSLLGHDFEILEAKYQRGLKSLTPPKSPHRLVVLVKRVETMITQLETGASLPLDHISRVSVKELRDALSLLEEARDAPGFADVGATINSTQDYAHTLVMLSARWFLEAIGNGRVEFIPTEASPRPDLRVHTSDGASWWHAEVYVPRDLIHPQSGALTADRATKLVGAALKRKKLQLASDDSFLLIGGLGCCAHTVGVLRQAAQAQLANHHRPRLLAIGIYSRCVITEYGGSAANPIPVALHTGSRTELAPNAHYEGILRLAADAGSDGRVRGVALTHADDRSDAQTEHGFQPGSAGAKPASSRTRG